VNDASVDPLFGKEERPNTSFCMLFARIQIKENKEHVPQHIHEAAMGLAREGILTRSTIFDRRILKIEAPFPCTFANLLADLAVPVKYICWTAALLLCRACSLGSSLACLYICSLIRTKLSHSDNQVQALTKMSASQLETKSRPLPLMTSAIGSF